MIYGLYQCASPGGDVEAGIATIDEALRKARVAGVDILTMPEMFLPGYGSTAATPPEGWDRGNERVAALAAKHGVALAIGLAEYAADALYNTAFVFDETGAEIARHRKIQLWGPDEAALYAPGDELTVFDWRGRRLGLLICYDVEFPEHTRALARAGVEAILVPTANPKPFVNVNMITVAARALENTFTIVYANYTGVEGDLDYVGHSVIAGPDGYPLASVGFGEALIVAEATDEPGENQIPLSTQLADYRPAKGPK